MNIAEIIGWKPQTESWPEVNYGGPGDIPYVQHTRHYYEAPDGEEREPTIDDMIAWLRERCAALYVMAADDPYTPGDLLHETIAIHLIHNTGHSAFRTEGSLVEAIRAAVCDVHEIESR